MYKETEKHNPYSRKNVINGQGPLRLASKYFKAGIITMLNKRKYAHGEWTNVINASREIETIKKYEIGILERIITYLK